MIIRQKALVVLMIFSRVALGTGCSFEGSGGSNGAFFPGGGGAELS